MNATLPTLLAVAALAAFGAEAADAPKKEASFGSGKATGAYLTKEQLRACLTQQSSNVQQNAAMQKEQADLVAVKAEITRNGDALKEQIDTIDRTSADAVAAYNEKAQAREKQIDDYEARVNAFNDRVEAARVQRESFSKSCENRRYFEEDEIAIKRGK